MGFYPKLCQLWDADGSDDSVIVGLKSAHAFSREDEKRVGLVGKTQRDTGARAHAGEDDPRFLQARPEGELPWKAAIMGKPPVCRKTSSPHAAATWTQSPRNI